MSTDHAGDAGQPTLTESITSRVDARRQRRREELTEGGARYTGGEGSELKKQSEENCCANCGRDVSPRVARVAGDNHGRLKACKMCWADNSGRTFATDTIAAMHARKGNGHSVGGSE